MFKAPGFLWLFAHELRLLWRGSILVRTHKSVIAPLLIVGLLFQGVALLLAGKIVEHPLPLAQMLLAANLNLAFLFILMLSRGVISAVDTLFTRADVDLFLASPLPPGRVLLVRMIGVALSVAAPWALLGGVLANALAFYGQYWALAAYPMLLAEGLLVSAMAFALMVALLAWMPPGAAHRAGHALALFMGVFIFALGQAPRFIAPARLRAFWQALTPDPRNPATLLARALLGQPAPLLASLAVVLSLFLLAWAALSGRFAKGALTAAAHRPGGNASRQTGAFRATPFAALAAKNLRLLARFPGVVSQTFYRSLTLVPVAMILLGRVHFGGGVAVTVPLLVFLTGQLALFFISVMVGADDAPELAASAPVPLEMRDRAALFAAAYAALLLMALPLLGVLWRAAALIPVLLACMAGVGASNLLLGQRLPIPLVRARFGKAQTGTVLGLVLGVGVSSAWALASWLLATPSLAAFLQAG